MNSNLSIAKLRYDLRRMRSDSWSYSILPTLACNLACKYCYQNTRSKSMSEKDINEIISFIAINSGDSKNVFVNWYGGEPLLCADLVIRASRLMNDVLGKIGVKFYGDIITNGTLLSQEIAEKLTDAGIMSFQLTFDGAEDLHDKFRRYTNGNPTYHLVLKALEHLPEKSNVSIRVHLHDEQLDNLKKLLDDIATTRSKCKKNIYFATVNPLTATCSSMAESAYGTWIPQNSIFLKLESLIRHALKLGLSISTGTTSQFICGSVSRNSLVIEPDGTLKKCWLEVGNPDLAIGTIRKPVKISENNMNLVNWLTYDPVAMTDSECHACEWFERCYGGCPYMVRKGVKKPHRCHPCKGLIEEFLPKLVDELRAEGIGTYDAESGLIIPTRSKTSIN